MDIFYNLDLLSVGVVIAATLTLGFAVFLNQPKSATNRAFLAFSILTVLWGVANYTNYQPFPVDVSFWLLRISIFLAVWHTYTLLRFLHVYPNAEILVSHRFNYLTLPPAIIASALTLTPAVFESVALVSADGRIEQVTNGPGIAVFGLVVVGFVIASIVTLIKKYWVSDGILQKQLRTILLGIFITFSLLIIFNFIFPAFLNVASYQSLGALFIFPFLAFTTYAIFRHKLLNVKVISTEILMFALALITLVEVVVSDSVLILLLRVSVFVLVLTVGLLLVRSVIKEVKQREELQALSKELAGANEQLKALDKARAEFISIASHQLRTPPSTIKWYMAAILAGDFGELKPEIKAALERVHVTNNAQIATIDDLLNASRIERGKLEFFFESAEIEPIAAALVEQLQPLAQMKKLSIKYNKPTSPIPAIIMDHEKIRQVINNMIDNAIKYSKQGEITVGLAQNGDNIVVSVHDQGKGVKPDDSKTLFAKYSRGHDSATQATGLGLGLYVAKVIVEQHNGTIWVESEGEGKGSTFMFSLPIKSNLTATTVDLVQPNRDIIQATKL